MADLKKEFKKHDLLKWYNENFSKEEQSLMEEKYQFADGLSPDSFSFLTTLSTWFNTKANYELCKKLIEKSLSFLPEKKNNINIISLHFIYQTYIQFYYKNRDVDNNLDKAIDFCEKQIDIALKVANEFRKDEFYKELLPRHVGYQQLAIIYKKNKQWDKVILICNKGKSEGWNNDFEARIEEAQKHLNNN